MSSDGLIYQRLPDNLATVRGVACVLLVAFHVVGVNEDRGLCLPLESPWHYAMTMLELIRMPLFTTLSGLLYGVNRVSLDVLKPFTLKKLRRIAVPLIIVTLVTWVMREALRYPNVPLIDALTRSYEHFWFLQALLIIFAVVTLLDISWRPRLPGLLIVACAAAVFSAVTTVRGPFSIGGAIYLFPFFVFGMAVSQAPRRILAPGFGAAFMLVAIGILMCKALGMEGLGPKVSKDSIAGFICGCCAMLAFLSLMPRIDQLATIGKFSYTIYLWHVIFLAAGRTALRAAGIEDTALLFIGSTVCGLVGPILFHRVAERSDWLSIPFLGIAARRRLKPPLATV